MYESALAAAQLKFGAVIGSFDASAHYTSSPPGATELSVQQDLFGAIRLFERGQVALDVPFVATRRSIRGATEMGGGLGDLNASVRYDFVRAGASRVLPGIAALAGITLPSGTPPDAPNLGSLATGATGTGAFQVNAGVAIEQTFGPWLLGATTIVAQRTARTVGSSPGAVHVRLGPQCTVLAAVAYTFSNEAAIAMSASYLIEGDATINGADAVGTAHRLPTVTISAAVPIRDTWRIQGAMFANLPVAPLGLNQPAAAGLSLTIVHAWL